ncbi:MAG TPA: VPDSG-CTERM sorting domain-containing protein [Candidatus Dormibacteraeota bacterium]|nr:VPDSG-CTERM sorting domain-containing protein [Candidatus Dormibacteraeota bacterium]
MKINIIPTTKIAMLCAAFCAALFAFNPNARALTIGDEHELGFIVAGNVGDATRTLFVNHLIGMALGDSDTFMGNDFTRSMNDFGTLPTAVFDHNGTGTSVNLGGGGLYSYLYAKYDGPNAGSEVWYVGDLSGVITIPGFLGQYGLSGWTLFGPGGQGVPDGGTTLMLLGAALGALGMARRYIKS